MTSITATVGALMPAVSLPYALEYSLHVDAAVGMPHSSVSQSTAAVRAHHVFPMCKGDEACVFPPPPARP